MLGIETKGTWREMGRQIGETLGEELTTCVDRYFYGRLDAEKCAPGVRAIEATLREHCPELIDETDGMAEGTGIDRDAVLGYRFFNEVRYHMQEDCSAIFLADTPDGPLMGRNCDLGSGDPNLQICHLRRPSNAPASIQASYLGMLAGSGLNAHGLMMGNASAHAAKTFGNEGLPGGVLCHMLMRDCRTVADAAGMFSRHKVLGKGANTPVGDASGASTLFEFVPGLTPIATPRRADRDWQACTNFYFSPDVPNRSDAGYLENAYARYGRIQHQLEERGIPRSLETMKQLLREIAQPGLCCQGLHTGYSTIADPAHKTMHVAFGNPNQAEFEPIPL